MLLRNLVHQLNTTNLTRLQLLQAIQHALKPTLADLDRVHGDLLAGDELRGQVPESLAELEVLRLRGHVHAAGPFESFAYDGVAESCLQRKRRSGTVPVLSI